MPGTEKTQREHPEEVAEMFEGEPDIRSPLDTIEHRGVFRSLLRNALSRKHFLVTIGFLLVAIVLFTLFANAHSAPNDFPVRTPIKIETGLSVEETARLLSEQKIIRSPLVFRYVVKTHHEGETIKAATYYFEEVADVYAVASAITNGTNTVPPQQLVIPEGLRIDQIDSIVAEEIPGIAVGAFKKAAGNNEGYLFPDTYHIADDFTATEIVGLMQETFSEKIQTLSKEIAASPHSLDDIIIMASLLEREANTVESKRMVAGILWNRLEIGMALQVDAVFEYIYKKSAADLTSEDLLIDSPYNTYKNVGLPPTPIVNPGLESIRAALDPADTPYLYYITAPDGTFYYSETFEEHKANIARYLR